MTLKKALILAGMLVLALWLAFVMQDVVRFVFIVPLAYLWWGLNLLYSTIPQVVIWGVIVVLITFYFLNSLTALERPKIFIKWKTNTPEDSVETLAAALAKARGGIYNKWRVANRLAILARDLLIQRGDREHTKIVGPLVGRDWQPPESIRDYLEVGLNGSFADYPNRHWWLFKSAEPTPLDLDVEEVVEYLEWQMRIADNRE